MAGMLAPGNVSSYNVAPGVLPGEMDMRRRIALALLQQGTDASPVQHWAQGAARMAQSALGGYQLHQANQEDQAQRAASSQAILDSLGPDTAQSAAAPQPNPVAAALGPQAPAPEASGGPGPVAAALGSRPEVQPTTKVWGDKEAEAAGLYEPTGGPTRVAQALNPQQPPVLPVQSPSPTPVPNEAAALKAKVARLLQSGPAGAALAQQLIADFNKRQTEHLANAVSPLSPQETKQYPGAVQKDANGKLIYPPPSTNVALNANNSAETEYAKGKAQDALGLERSADKTLQERQQLQVFKSLVQDFKTGKLAPAQSTAGAWGDALGIDPKTMEKFGIPANAAVDGQLIESLSNQMTLGMIGTKGGEGGSMPANNFSDADRKFLTNTVPGLARVHGGNLVLAEIKQRGLDRHLDKISMWDEYRSQGKKYEDFERDWRKKIRSEPSLFADIPQMIQQMSAQPPPPPKGVDPAALEEARKRGLIK